MEHFIIGSRLFVNLFPTNERVQKRLKVDADWDVLLEHEPNDDVKQSYFNLFNTRKIDFHVIPPLWQYLNNPDLKCDLRDVYFTLKASHVSFDSVWKDKTFYDLHLMSEEGCKIIEPLYFDLHKYWSEKFGEKWRADFNKESADFFDDAVSRENLHDELHKSVAYYDVPAFKFLQEEGQTTVWVCPEKFKNTTEHIRQRVVIEEAQTLALERFIVPKIINNKYIAYQKMLKALVDRLCPLWMVPYILNNFHYFMTFREDYGQHIKPTT